MLDVDAATLAAIRGTFHVPGARISACDPDGTIREVFDLSERRIVGGATSYDRTALCRRTATVELANPTGSLSPQRVGDLFATGSRVRIERAVDGAWLQGMDGIVTGFDASMQGVLSLRVSDPLWLLDQPFGEVAGVSAGMTAEAAFVHLAAPVLEPIVGPSSGWSLDGDGRTVLARDFGEEESRGAAIAELMAALGLEAFADRRGIPVLRPVPDPTAATAVRTFVQAPGLARMLDLARSSDQRRYNRVVVIRDAPDLLPLRGVSDVTDPASPLHRDRIGLQVAPIIRRADIPDQASLNAVARVRLIGLALDTDAVGGTAVPDPTLDEDDVVIFREQVTGTDAAYRLDRVSHPIVTGGMGLDATRVTGLFA